jgi:hypothetical protein
LNGDNDISLTMKSDSPEVYEQRFASNASHVNSTGIGALDVDRQAQDRERVEPSTLIELAALVCSEINARAGTLVIEGQSYLPPQTLMRSFVFINGTSEYEMQIGVLGRTPVLTFLERHWRDLSRNPFIRVLYDLGALQALVVRTRFCCLINAQRVTREEVEKWFSYLLSGLRSDSEPRSRSGVIRKVHHSKVSSL